MSDKVFISYANKDKYFAELLATRLESREISVWRDVSAIRVGDEWRDSIDKGIRESAALVLAISQASAASHYVTYEWATAAAYGKTIIPILLEDCVRYPKIEPIQYMDFRNHNESSWDALAQRIKEIVEQSEETSGDLANAGKQNALSLKEEKARSEIKSYLGRKGFRVVSFYAVRERIDKDLDEAFLKSLVEKVEEFSLAKVRIKNSTKTRPGLRWF